jgi:hypothetical protein
MHRSREISRGALVRAPKVIKEKVEFTKVSESKLNNIYRLMVSVSISRIGKMGRDQAGKFYITTIVCKPYVNCLD